MNIQFRYIFIGALAVLVVPLLVKTLFFSPVPDTVYASKTLTPLGATTTHSGFNTPSTSTNSAGTPYDVFLKDIADQKAQDSSTISLQFFGDIMLDRNVAVAMGKNRLAYLFDDIKNPGEHLFGGTDILVANLEGPFALKRVPTSKSIAFRFDPVLAQDLKDYGFTGFNLANNHSYDMGRANVQFTRETLQKAGLGYFGDELNEGTDYTWYWTSPTSSGQTVTIAFLGFHNTYHNVDFKKAEAALKDAQAKAQYVIVNIHAGEEYHRNSTKKQQDLAHWLVDHGADAVIGHHPHVVEEMEIYKDKPIFYSLGNFIFDQYFSNDTQEGFSVGMTLASGKVASVYIFPFYSVKSKVFPMKDARRDGFLKWMGDNSRLDRRSIVGGKVDIVSSSKY